MSGQETAITLTVIAASNLKKVTTFTKQSPFAVAYIEPDRKHKTKVDDDGGVNPKWNSRLFLEADEQQVQQGRTIITLEIRSNGIFYDALIGTAKIPLANIRKDGSGGPQKMVFTLQRPSGRTQGIVEISIDLGVSKPHVQVYQNPPPLPAPALPVGGQENPPQQPPVSYPSVPAPLASGQGYAPQQGYPPQYGYRPQGYPQPQYAPQGYPPQLGYPPQQGYPPQGYPQPQYAPQGYPAQQASYPPQQPGYYQQQSNPPQQGSNEQQAKKKTGGIGALGGAGLGLGAGLVGGLVAGEVIEKMKHNHEVYDNGASDYNNVGMNFDGGDDDGLSF